MVTELIELDRIDKQLVLLSKGHMESKYPFNETWVKTLIPFYNDHYALDSEENLKTFKKCMFNKLLTLLIKLSESDAQKEKQITEVFHVSFNKTLTYNEEESIDRAITKLCHFIANSNYFDSDNITRFSFDSERIEWK